MISLSKLTVVLLFIPTLAFAQQNAADKRPQAAPNQTRQQMTPKTDKVEYGMGVICDTAQMMQQYLVLYKDDVPPENAIRSVNASTGKTGACGMASIAFKTGDDVGRMNFSGGVMRIVKIMVVGLKTPNGWLNIPPTEQYTALFEKLDEA